MKTSFSTLKYFLMIASVSAFCELKHDKLDQNDYNIGTLTSVSSLIKRYPFQSLMSSLNALLHEETVSTRHLLNTLDSFEKARSMTLLAISLETIKTKINSHVSN